MKVGVVILPDLRWSEAIQRWKRAERYGFAHAWTYDHIGWRELVDGPWFDAVATLAAAATVTSRIRLGPLVASPNFRHPVSFVREITALDDLSDGRVLLGVGAGGSGFDAEVLGSPALSTRIRVDRYAEFLELLDLLLREDHVTWRGTHFAAQDARNLPGCVQVPRVPFVVAANGPRSMALAATFGDGWVTTGVVTDNQDAWWRAAAEASSRFQEVAARVAARTGATRVFRRYLLTGTSPTSPLASVAVLAETIGRAEACGYTDVILHWPRREGWYAGDEAVLEAAAAELSFGAESG